MQDLNDPPTPGWHQSAQTVNRLTRSARRHPSASIPKLHVGPGFVDHVVGLGGTAVTSISILAGVSFSVDNSLKAPIMTGKFLHHKLNAAGVK